MSNINICKSIDKLNETIATVVRDVSSVSNSVANIKHSIGLLSIKIDQITNSAVVGTTTTAESVNKVLPPSLVKKLSYKECEEKISDLVLTLKEVLRTFPVIEKIS